MEDVVVESYKRQIKESILKSEIIKTGGFDIIVDYLEQHGVDTSRLKTFFLKIKKSRTLDDLNQLTMDELLDIVDDINRQVTHELISQAEVGDYLLRKSNVIAHEKSINGVVDKNNRFLVIGNNLSEVVMRHGVAEGIKLCIKNYCNQKIYQANYRERLKEKEIELGIYQDEANILEKKREIKKRFNDEVSSKILDSTDSKKSLLMTELFGHDVSSNSSFSDSSRIYFVKFNEKLNNREV